MMNDLPEGQTQHDQTPACAASRAESANSTGGLERMVQEAGWSGIYTQWTSPTERESMTVPVTPEQVRKFAELVALAEREECAKVCEAEATFFKSDNDGSSIGASVCADSIRARSNVEHQGLPKAVPLNGPVGPETE